MNNLENINNKDNLERWENLVIQAQTTAKLIEINKTITDAVNEFNMVMNSSNNVDYKPNSTSNMSMNSVNNTEEPKSEKIETVADKINEFKNETLSNKVDVDNISSENENNTNKVEVDNIIPETKNKNTKSKKIDISSILSWNKNESKDETPKVDINNITKNSIEESTKTEEELAQELDAKKLLNEANKLEEGKKPANNESYDNTENNKKTGTDWPAIDVSHII